MSKLTKNERLVLSTVSEYKQSHKSIFIRLKDKGHTFSTLELQDMLIDLEKKGYIAKQNSDFVLVQKTSKTSKVIQFVLLLAFGAFLLSGPVAVVVWIWQTTFTVAAKYAASYGVVMLTVVWFGFLFKWSEMMQNRYDG